MMIRCCLVALVAIFGFSNTRSACSDDPADTISFSQKVRPLLAEKCFGCHQPAQARGTYIMTDFDRMVQGGESNEKAIVPGEAVHSHLIAMITSLDGKAEMPPNADPLTTDEVELIRNWINQGATNDFSRIVNEFTNENPPAYSRQPNISSLHFSPDGKILAISGFNEVLLLKFDEPNAESISVSTAQVVRRLIGLSSRIESVQFSPDGKKLAASGGIPGELGEVQIWNVEDGTLALSKIVSHDTVYGVSWSPDGLKLSFGCTDNSLRVIEAETGKQILFQGAHDDWVRDTVFSVDGSQLVSVGRDMSCKLIDVATQRFIDNVTSITPGALKGGIAAVARHPSRDEILIGGADGIPKIYRLNRLTKRVIGDDANMIRKMPVMPGRIQSVAIANSGLRFAAAGSLDGSGAINIFSYEFDPSQPEDIKAIVSKTVDSQSAEEKKRLEEFLTLDVKQIATTDVSGSGVYAIDFHPTGKWIAAGGRDGQIRFIETETGKIVGSANPINLSQEIAESTAIAEKRPDWYFKNENNQDNVAIQSTMPVNASRLYVFPGEISFQLPIDYAQLVVQAELQDGSRIDVTSESQLEFDPSVVEANKQLIQVAGNGTTEIKVNWNGLSASVPVKVSLTESAFEPDFSRDVNPVLSKLGCNAGTCHGSQGGKKGFKLSLRGYDPIYDIRAFTDDMASRRTNLASPAASLMLLKPTAQVPHEGGKVIDIDSRYYHLLHDWVRSGATLNSSSAKVASIELFPKNPTLLDAGSFQQVRVVATYADGTIRDVTREAIIEAGDMEIASASGSVIKALRRGEAPILARYEGAFAATTLTVMGNRDGFVWNDPETWGTIDELVSQKWKRMKIQPSELCSDDEFIRRVYLDLSGLPPTAEQVDVFLSDERPTRVKRDELVDKLIGTEPFIEHWSNKWADMLQVNRKYLGSEGAVAFREWINGQVKSNRPYNEFAYEILTASGPTRENPPASYFKIHRTPDELMENTTHLFLATRFNCNKCHDHPFEKWTQDQYYETAAFFSQVGRAMDPMSGDKTIGGSAVEGATPLYEIISDLEQGDVTHIRTGQIAPPVFPFESEFSAPENATRRARLAAWITSPKNPYFATSYVNRLWGYMNGSGLIEPLDDIRAGNPATNPELLAYLRDEFVSHQFDMQYMLKLICKSRTYQLSVKTNDFNRDDGLNFSHAKARRLPAEVLFDSIHLVTGSSLKIPGVKPGTRAAAIADSEVALPSGFLTTLGRPARESACECERANDLQLGSVLALVSGPDLSNAINDSENDLARMATQVMDDRELVDQLYLKILNRHANEVEIDGAIATFAISDADHASLIENRDAEKMKFDSLLPELEQQRSTAVAETAGLLDQTIKQLDPNLIQRESEHAANLAATESEFSKYKEQSVGFDQWKLQQLKSIQWHPLNVAEFQSQNGRPFSIGDDRSVLLQQKPGKDIYTFVAATDLSGVSAVRLELLSHDSLASKGPGLANNGNLVLTEFEMEIAHPDLPDLWQKVEFASAIANFEQEGFPIAKAIDGKADDLAGWALMNSQGKTNWATFQLKLPVGFSGGTLVRFKLHQTFDDQHQIGRLRISVSKHHQPVGLGLGESLLAELVKPAAELTDETRTQLTSAFERGDPQLLALQEKLKAAQTPLEIAREIIDLREKLARVSKPVPRNPTLVQLENDVITSQQQLGNHRLTATQDLAWALINSPSFLFNR